jgi:hypothetical protein
MAFHPRLTASGVITHMLLLHRDRRLRRCGG